VLEEIEEEDEIDQVSLTERARDLALLCCWLPSLVQSVGL
jgi:hypothetical protein